MEEETGNIHPASQRRIGESDRLCRGVRTIWTAVTNNAESVVSERER